MCDSGCDRYISVQTGLDCENSFHYTFIDTFNPTPKNIASPKPGNPLLVDLGFKYEGKSTLYI